MLDAAILNVSENTCSAEKWE